ncbi:NAD(P)H-dependent flavin oxidoreductase [Nocardia sp. NPDC051052]|uniref:NAD(P)H-dependent flavin oxidoreductase n=1 Tax=Nocardia sp. NPDC051052 TaxID=3364322 RepID=UPI00378A00B8
MFDFRSLTVPVVGAPMAGGPSTPELVAAVGAAGGFGFLATGYAAAAKVGRDIAELRQRTDAPFGLNVFVPESISVDVSSLDAYRALLAERAARFGAHLPHEIPYSDDDFDAKIALAIDESVPVVSFTFGAPTVEVIARLHRHDICVVSTVTTVAEARLAAAAGVDALCVQGPEAGGHRGTFHIADTPGELSLDQLLEQVRAVTELPLIASGGIATADRAVPLLALGADAVQVGTLLLRTPEAGTKPAHKDALADPRFTETVLTRAFSGRPARALRNSFVDEFSAAAPAAYPYVNTLTAALRKAAAADPDTLNLWAGTGYRHAGTEPAAVVIARLGAQIAELRCTPSHSDLTLTSHRAARE